MKIKEFKNKIVLAELDPKMDYLMLVNPAYFRMDQLKYLRVKARVQIMVVQDTEKAIKFVEIPKKKS